MTEKDRRLETVSFRVGEAMERLDARTSPGAGRGSVARRDLMRYYALLDLCGSKPNADTRTKLGPLADMTDIDTITAVVRAVTSNDALTPLECVALLDRATQA